MGKYIKKFLDHQEYQSFTGTTSFKLPNVSYCENQNEVHYNPLVIYVLTCKYYVTSISQPTILYNPPKVNIMIIDSETVLDSEKGELVSAYTFNTTGEHVVQYQINGTSPTKNLVFYIMTCKYNVTSTSQPTKLFNTSCFSMMVIDGEIVFNTNQITSSYTFSTTGEHTVQYYINGEEKICNYCLYDCDSLIEVIIPDNIKNVGLNAFSECNNLTGVTIPDSVETIGGWAFDCPNNKLKRVNSEIDGELYINSNIINSYSFSHDNSDITNITFGPNVKMLYGRPFYIMKGLTNIHIPSNIIKIDVNPFQSSTNVTAITVDAQNQYYDSRDNCNAIIETTTNTLKTGCKNTVIPNTVRIIGISSFSDIEGGFDEITIPNGVEEIETEAFRATSLKRINISSSVTSINGDAFAFCNDLSGITLDNNNPIYDSRGNCNAIIETATNKLVVGSNTTVIPNGIVEIGDYAFAGRWPIYSFSLPNTVQILGDNAFMLYRTISDTLTISSAVTSISETAFGGHKIKKFVVDTNNTVYDSRNDCGAIIRTSDNCLIAGGSKSVIPNTVTKLGSTAFYNLDITSCTIPSSVISIGKYAFHACGQLISVTVENVIPPISNIYTFEKCKKLKIYVPSGSVDAYKNADGWKEYASRIYPIE